MFADPAATTLADLAASALTVWLRINRKAPYIDLRWQQGLYLPNGSTEPDRIAQVDPMWQALPLSNGRTDFHASRLSGVLFGGHARCVSFLSTSVRSSPTPNLLAQPLNDLSPARIFDAIANLTGLDRELEQEQALRGKEHAHRVEVRSAERDLETWEAEITVVEAGIAQRREARDHLGAARTAWHSRCARHLIDGLERASQIRAEIGELDDRAERLGEELTAISSQIAAISDDRELARRLAGAKKHRDELAERDRALDTEHQVTARELGDLAGRHRELAEAARGADGRSAETAGAELAAAREELELSLGAHGAAEAAERHARDLLDAAESGQDLAVAQLRLLDKAGVPAAALLDVIDLAPAQRAEWEPRLALYGEAAVVHRAQRDTARDVLADLPGSTLILAHRAALARGIKNTLSQVAQAFDELDQAYGGYGAGLDYPEPEPPAEPDRPWQWTVAPKWRRAEGQRMGGYNLKANTAQIDEKAAKLVCAAAQAASGDRPLILILDELGRNLGKQHRREAVALFERIGRDRNITVVGALQDDMERYAIEASGLYVKLRRSSDAIAYNEPPVIAGDEANRPRVELLQQWLTSYRPAAAPASQQPGPADQLTAFGGEARA